MGGFGPPTPITFGRKERQVGAMAVSMTKRCGEIAKLAETLVRERGATWVGVHNALFGMGGKVAQLFTTESERVAFTQSAEFRKITTLMDQLHADGGNALPVAELTAKANGAISVRLPKCIHAALIAEADAEGVSLNQLCLAKLAVQLRAVV